MENNSMSFMPFMVKALGSRLVPPLAGRSKRP